MHNNRSIISESSHTAVETLEYILGENGEPVYEKTLDTFLETVYQTTIPMYQPTSSSSSSSNNGEKRKAKK